MKALITTLLMFAGIFQTALANDTAVSTPAKTAKPVVNMKDRDFLDGLTTRFCLELFKDEFLGKVLTKGFKGKMMKRCLNISSFDELDKMIDSETSACTKWCEQDVKGTPAEQEKIRCEMNTCMEACEGEGRAGKLSSKSYKKGFGTDLETAMEPFLNELCDELYAPKIMEKKLFKEHRKIWPKENFELHKRYDYIVPYDRGESMQKISSYNHKSFDDFRDLCKKAKSDEQLKAAMKKGFDICLENCKGRAVAEAKAAGKDAAAIAAIQCKAQGCEARCAGEERAGKLSAELFFDGLNASH